MKQKTTIESYNESNANGTSVCVPLDAINSPPNDMLSCLIEAINGLKTLELLDLSTFEEECVSKNIKQPKELNDSNINMNKHYVRKHRQKFRRELKKGLPMPNVLLHAHHFHNNKPSVWIVFKVDSDKQEQHFTEGVKACACKTSLTMSKH